MAGVLGSLIMPLLWFLWRRTVILIFEHGAAKMTAVDPTHGLLLGKGRPGRSGRWNRFAYHSDLFLHRTIPLRKSTRACTQYHSSRSRSRSRFEVLSERTQGTLLRCCSGRL
jgi:hypothetical protein